MKHPRSTAVVAAVSAAALLLAVPSSADEETDRRRELRQELVDRAATSPPAGTVTAERSASRATTTARAEQVTVDCRTDATGDPDPGPYPEADLVEWCAMMDDSVFLTHTNATPTDPSTDPNWVNGLTGLLWDLDVDLDGTEEYSVFLVNGGSGPVLEVTDQDLNTLCSGAWDYDGRDYAGLFPSSCIGNPSKMGVSAFVAYDSQWDDPNAPVYADSSEGFMGPIERASDPADGEDKPPATPTSGGGGDGPVELGRLAGGDRFTTAIRISQYEFPDGASEVYLARADNFPDALAGGALSRGPVLLVPSCDTVPNEVIEEAARLAPKKVIALGGEGAICDDVLNAFAGL